MSLLQQAQLNRTARIEPLAQVVQSATVSTSASASSMSQEVDLGTARFILITSRDLLSSEMDALKFHGQVVQYNTQLFQGVASLDAVKFSYLIFDINDSSAREWLSNYIYTVKDYVIVITPDKLDDDDSSWLRTLVEGGYVTNVIKQIPVINLSTEIFNSKFLSRVHIPHRISLCEKIFQKVLPYCVTGAAATASTVGSGVASKLSVIVPFAH